MQITIDGWFLGKEGPPSFPGAKEKGLPPLLGQYINFVKVDTEGYDVAVVHGMMRTFVEGQVPLVRGCTKQGARARARTRPPAHNTTRHPLPLYPPPPFPAPTHFLTRARRC